MAYRSTWLCTLLLGMLATTPALGEDPPKPAEDKAAAVTLAEAGWVHYKAGRYSDALRAFRDAEATAHAPAFLLMVARSYVKLGRLREARAMYRLIVDEKPAANASFASVQARNNAKTELDALVPRIATVEIMGTGAASGAVTMTLDGSRVAPSTPVERDPGEHTLVVNSPGRLPLTRTLRIAEGAKERVVIDQASLDAQPLAEGPAGAEGQAESALIGMSGREATPVPDAADAFGGRWRTTVLVGGGVATGVGVITGVIFTVLSNGKASEADALWLKVDKIGRSVDCSDKDALAPCGDLLDARDTQEVFANTAFWSFVGVGAVGVGTLVYGLVTRRPPEPERHVQITPLVGPNSIGISLGGVL